MALDWTKILVAWISAGAGAVLGSVSGAIETAKVIDRAPTIRFDEFAPDGAPVYSLANSIRTLV
jgi:hypothetical protein